MQLLQAHQPLPFFYRFGLESAVEIDLLPESFNSFPSSSSSAFGVVRC